MYVLRFGIRHDKYEYFSGKPESAFEWNKVKIVRNYVRQLQMVQNVLKL